ncbi:MAG: arginine deiminase-related protein [Xanthomonadales bacterium]|nr:arginine deiminase-related protein [Xanthomonadales bacterium]
MVRPDRFRVADESAVDNPYMDLGSPVDADRAARQAEGLIEAVRACGIEVKVFAGDPDAPDGVFPNNVFATVPGRLLVGSMFHPGRRVEAGRRDIREWFARRGYEAHDLAARACVAELTGPMVLDRARGLGFCGMSNRVDEAGLAAMHQAFDLRMTFSFALQPDEYHTNVLMSILAARACVLCPEAFADPDVPRAISVAFPGRTLELDAGEKNAFAANCIALTHKDLFISRTAADALRPASLHTLEQWGFRLHAVELDEIEKAGGSLRCMVGEVF